MILLSAHRGEIEFQCDDDKWSHLRLTTSHCGLQRPPLFLLVEARVSLKFFAEIFTPYRCICDWESEFSPLSDVILSSSVDFWRVQLSQLLTVGNHNISFPDSRNQCISEESGGTFLPNWRSRGWYFPEIGYSTIAPNGITWPLNGSPNRLSQSVFHICPEDNNSIPKNRPTIFHPSQMAIVQQRPFFYSAHCSFSNAIRLGSMGRWSTMIPW